MRQDAQPKVLKYRKQIQPLPMVSPHTPSLPKFLPHSRPAGFSRARRLEPRVGVIFLSLAQQRILAMIDGKTFWIAVRLSTRAFSLRDQLWLYLCESNLLGPGGLFRRSTRAWAILDVFIQNDHGSFGRVEASQDGCAID